MISAHEKSELSTAPTLSAMFAGYLQRQARAHASGLGGNPIGEVVPFEAVPVQATDPKLAWREAIQALQGLENQNPESMSPPPDWGYLVANQEPLTALPFCIGNFPQLVRDLHALLSREGMGKVRKTTQRDIDSPELLDWVKRAGWKKPDSPLLGVGMLRLARHFELAAEFVRQHQKGVPAVLREAWNNEVAALAWQGGNREEGAKLWKALSEFLPIIFNRGMAALFLGKPVEARQNLSQVASQIPQESGWHHLARLYVNLAEM